MKQFFRGLQKEVDGLIGEGNCRIETETLGCHVFQKAAKSKFWNGKQSRVPFGQSFRELISSNRFSSCSKTKKEQMTSAWFARMISPNETRDMDTFSGATKALARSRRVSSFSNPT